MASPRVAIKRTSLKHLKYCKCFKEVRLIATRGGAKQSESARCL